MFDLEGVLHVISVKKPLRVVLQFENHLVSSALSVYRFLSAKLERNVQLIIAADSTWSSSVDDITAAHVDSDLLVYFGSDYGTTSSSLPLLMVPELIDFSCYKAQLAIQELCSQAILGESTGVLLYEPGCMWAAVKIGFQLSLHVARPKSLIAGTLEVSSSFDARTMEHIAGLCFPKLTLAEGDHRHFVYIGNNAELVDKIMLNASSSALIWYEPKSGKAKTLIGKDSKLLQERYAIVSKVEKATTIGIILGSMGINAESTKKLIYRLERLLKAAGKSFYTFVMGRIEESKLENFPEIDLFCLITSDSAGFVKPKHFRRPVITPLELELGVGARKWDFRLSSDVDAILAEDLAACEAEIARHHYELYGGEDGEVESYDSSSKPTETTLTLREERAVTVRSSSASEFFNTRTFKGLEPVAASSEKVEITLGKMGIASKYTQLEADDSF